MRAASPTLTQIPESNGVTASSPELNSQLTKQLTEQFQELRLPMFRKEFEGLSERAAQEPMSHLEYLSELECQARREGRITRLLALRLERLDPTIGRSTHGSY